MHRQFGTVVLTRSRKRSARMTGRRQRAFGQSQLRRPRLARLPGQLPGLAAARGRLCAQGHGSLRHDQRADRHRVQWRGRLSQGHLALQRGNTGADRRPCPFGHVQKALCRRLPRRRPLARNRGDRRRHVQLAAGIDLYPEPALLHRHHDGAGAPAGHRSGRARWPSSAIRSPPTTFRLQERSRSTAQPAAICSTTTCRAGSSTATARVAATTR
jgi:hypothetical protein